MHIEAVDNKKKIYTPKKAVGDRAFEHVKITKELDEKLFLNNHPELDRDLIISLNKNHKAAIQFIKMNPMYKKELQQINPSLFKESITEKVSTALNTIKEIFNSRFIN